MCKSSARKQLSMGSLDDPDGNAAKNVLISCLPVSLYPMIRDGKMDIIKWSEIAFDMGLDAIDINMFFLEGRSLKETVALREKLRLPVLMACTYSDFTNPDAKGRAKAIEKAQGEIRIAGELGVRYFRLTAGPNYQNLSEKETIANVTECFAACVPAAEKGDLRLLVENHSRPGAWQYDDFNFHSERFLRLWEALATLPVGVNFDIANAFALGCWEKLLHSVDGRVETVHVNDISSISPLRFCCAGEGIVPIGKMLETAFRTGFRGPVCIEEAGMCGVEGMLRAVNAVKTLCSENFKNR